MEEDTEKQYKKQNYDWLKGYQFVKGQSGNPGGKKKGTKSLKTFVKEYLEDLPEEEKIEFLKTLPGEMVWRMAEGNPKQDIDAKVEGDIIVKQTIYGSTNTLQVRPKTISDSISESNPEPEVQ